MAVEIHRLSLEYLWWPLRSDVDLVPALAEVAIVEAQATPSSGDWVEASIVSPTSADAQQGIDFWVRLLFGPGGIVERAPGDWQAWVRVEANPERPVRAAGIVTVL